MTEFQAFVPGSTSAPAGFSSSAQGQQQPDKPYVHPVPPTNLLGKRVSYFDEINKQHNLVAFDPARCVFGKRTTNKTFGGTSIPVHYNANFLDGRDAYVPLRIQGPKMRAPWGVSSGETFKTRSINFELVPADNKNTAQEAAALWTLWNTLDAFDKVKLAAALKNRNDWWPGEEYLDAQVGFSVTPILKPRVNPKDGKKYFPRVQAKIADGKYPTKLFHADMKTPATLADINHNAILQPVFECTASPKFNIVLLFSFAVHRDFGSEDPLTRQAGNLSLW
jgi:hypothetical protein